MGKYCNPKIFEHATSDSEDVRMVKDYLLANAQAVHRIENEKDDVASKLKNTILDATAFADDGKTTFLTRVYFFLMGYTDYPKCKRCGKPITDGKIKVLAEAHKFPKYCSSVCKYDNQSTVDHNIKIAKHNEWLRTLNDKELTEKLQYVIDTHPYNHVTHINAKNGMWSYLREWIMKKTAHLDGRYTMHTRIGWILSGYTDFPKCQCPTCGHTFEGRNIDRGTFKYPRFCSQKCQMNTPEMIELALATKAKTFGDRTLKRRLEIAHEKCEAGRKLSDEAKIEIIKDIVAKNPTSYAGIISSRCAFGHGDDNSYLVEFINGKTKALKGHDYSFKTRLYWVLNGLNDFPKCKICGKKLKKKNVITLEDGYQEYCSLKCRMHDKEYVKKIFRKYVYNGIPFHSSWELAYYIWLTDNNVDFVYHPLDGLEYEFCGKIHYYFPDFIVNGKFIELKGDQFFDKNGNLINPYSDDNGRSEAKFRCMMANDVTIMRQDAVQPYIDYVCETYGNNYLKSFKM